MKKQILLTFTLLCAVTQGVWAQWNGNGTEDSPYEISSAADWNTLATKVNSGENYNGAFFQMVASPLWALTAPQKSSPPTRPTSTWVLTTPSIIRGAMA